LKNEKMNKKSKKLENGQKLKKKRLRKKEKKR